MSTSNQALCASFGHNWAAWGNFFPVIEQYKIVHASYVPVPEKELMVAYRWRECRRCGAKQREHFGTRTREIIDEN